MDVINQELHEDDHQEVLCHQLSSASELLSEEHREYTAAQFIVCCILILIAINPNFPRTQPHYSAQEAMKTLLIKPVLCIDLCIILQLKLS